MSPVDADTIRLWREEGVIRGSPFDGRIEVNIGVESRDGGWTKVWRWAPAGVPRVHFGGCRPAV
jgi:hypothetical protein